MAILYILIGIPASGKTTYAHKISENTGATIHEYDSVKRFLNNPKDYELIKEVWLEGMRSDLLAGHDVICDNTSLTAEYRVSLLREFSDIECKKIAIVIDTPIRDCLRRNRERIHKVSDFSIALAADMFEMPNKTEGWDEIVIIKN